VKLEDLANVLQEQRETDLRNDKEWREATTTVLAEIKNDVKGHTERIVCVETRQKTIWGVLCAIGCGVITIIGGVFTWMFTGK